jgi:hypothetical protein
MKFMINQKGFVSVGGAKSKINFGDKKCVYAMANLQND